MEHLLSKQSLLIFAAGAVAGAVLVFISMNSTGNYSAQVGSPGPGPVASCLCGNNIIDPGEQCDDGKVCILNPMTNCQTDADCSAVALCTLNPATGRKECPDGSGCVVNNDCADACVQFNGDGCNNDCRITAICGDGTVQGMEQCDDGNTMSGDGCSSTCLLELPQCSDGVDNDGDGLIDAADPGCHTDENAGNAGSYDPNDNDERNILPVSCGNGIIEGLEQCDDGKQCIGGEGGFIDCTFDVRMCLIPTLCFPQAGDGCSALCQNEICGNNIHDPGEECDDGKQCVLNPGASCQTSTQCSVLALCIADAKGDRFCPNGSGCVVDNDCTDTCVQIDNDSCPNNCRFPAICGDGVVQGVEQCDDGNRDNTDLCSDQCLFTTCGDGIIQNPNGQDILELCDDGNTTIGDGCSSACQLESPQCGDGVDNDGDTLIDAADPGCHTDGNAGNEASFNSNDNDETHTPFCGNGAVEASEQCDDGNTTNGDGCSNACLLELSQCGDGVVTGNEGCDVGGNVGCVFGERCAPDCSVCGPITAQCNDTVDNDGDGLIDVADPGCHTDGNVANAASYDPNDNDETHTPSCGNGAVEVGEQCDDGNTKNGDGCSSTCQLETDELGPSPGSEPEPEPDADDE